MICKHMHKIHLVQNQENRPGIVKTKNIKKSK